MVTKISVFGRISGVSQPYIWRMSAVPNLPICQNVKPANEVRWGYVKVTVVDIWSYFRVNLLRFIFK